MNIRYRIRTILVGIATALLLQACATARETWRHERLYSTLWLQTSTEYYAIATQTYRAATEKLALALSDPSWTAATEQTGDFGGLPPAVVLDVDETVLDNSPYEARNIRTDSHYEPKSWAAWCGEATDTKPIWER